MGPLRSEAIPRRVRKDSPSLPRSMDGFFRFPSEGTEGDWVEYRTTYTGSGRTETAYWALIGKEQAGSWVERRIPWEEGQFVVTRFYVEQSGRVTRAYTGLSGSVGKSIEIHEISGEEEREEVEREAENLETAMGSLECVRVVYEGDFGETTVWTSPQVPFEGIVRMITDLVRLELVRFGRDAKPSLEIPSG